MTSLTTELSLNLTQSEYSFEPSLSLTASNSTDQPFVYSVFQSIFFKLCVSVLLTFISVFTLLGNLLIVVAVITTKTLHTVTNSFIVSLAVADMLVPVFIEPMSIYMVLFNDWKFGSLVCDFWIGTDVMLCTASILNLCCISLDRYFAITRPLTYTQKRSPKLARTMIALVWIMSVLIAIPPVFGWKDKNRDENTCSLNLLLSYRIYSSMGSFFIPCIIMVFVYIRIFIVIHNREVYLQNSAAKSIATNAEKKRLTHMKKKEADENSQHSLSMYDLNNNNNAQSSSNKNNKHRSQNVFFKKTFSKNQEDTVHLDALKNDSNCNRNNHLNCSGNKHVETVSGYSDSNNQIKIEVSSRSRQNSYNDLIRPNAQAPQGSGDGSEVDLNNETKFVVKNGKTSKLKSLGRNLSIWSYGSNNVNKTSKGNAKFQEQLRIAKESKAAKKLSIVVGAFILSWLPFFVLYVIEALLPPNSVNPNLANSLTWFGYCNSAANPIIYSFLSNPFRKAFYRIMIGRFKKKRETTLISASALKRSVKRSHH